MIVFFCVANMKTIVNKLWKSGAITDPKLLPGEQGNGHWDWSWLEKWMAGRSWDGHAISKEIPDVSSLQSHEESQPDSGYTNTSGKMWKPSSAPGLPSPARSKVVKPHASVQTPSAYRYSRPAAAKSQLTHPQDFGLVEENEADFLKARSSALAPTTSKGSSKQSTTSSSVHDDDDLRPVPSYMASTKSAKAKSRSQSTPKQRSAIPEKDTLSSSAKKRLSYPLTGSLNGTSGPLKSSNRQQGPPRSPGLKGMSGPLNLYHSYNDVSIGSIASLNGQMRRRFK